MIDSSEFKHHVLMSGVQTSILATKVGCQNMFGSEFTDECSLQIFSLGFSSLNFLGRKYLTV